MEQAVLGLDHGLTFLGGQEAVHLLGGDLDTLAYVAALNPLDDHLPPDLLAHLGVGLAPLLQGDPELLQGHAVLGGDRLDGIVQLRIGNPHARPQAHLQLDALQNEPVQGLPDQDVLRRQFYPPGVQRFGHTGQPFAQFTGHDDVVIHNSHHLVEHFGRRPRRGDRSDAGDQACRQQKNPNNHVPDNL